VSQHTTKLAILSYATNVERRTAEVSIFNEDLHEKQSHRSVSSTRIGCFVMFVIYSRIDMTLTAQEIDDVSET
jgi:hypothetical protein